MFKSSIKISPFLEPISSLDYCFSIQSQRRISPIFVDCSQEELEPQNKNPAYCSLYEKTNGTYKRLFQVHIMIAGGF